MASRVRIAPGSLASLGRFAAEVTRAKRVALVTDRTVARLWGARAARSLRAAGLAVHPLVVAAGERSKRPEELARLWRGFADAGLSRSDAVVALGGGVVGDLAGFAAATWLRGVRWVGVPTTLVAQVDSSIGGKTAIDLPEGKNLAGAFHQPAGVLVDPETLATLPARHVRAGLAEVIKKGFAVDARLFAWCERHAEALAAGEPAALAGAVARAIRAKARVVMSDEREREGGRRTALNFGHTLGHAIEAAHGYRGILHGEAVAIGMRAAAEMSVAVAGLALEDRIRLEALLDLVGLPLRMPPTRIGKLLVAMQSDKKRANRRIRWVLTPRVGDASVPRAVPNPLVRAVLLHAGARG
jgi:3-dehydroquinate synthase